ncbi:MAG: proteasome accessory factor PafA2 family protein [Thermodesulfobacteriota bacterium]
MTKSFAIDLLNQLETDGVKRICGDNFVLSEKKAREKHAYFLKNGCKVYADEISRPEGGKYRIFEIATPEVNNALDIVRYDKATEKIARLVAQVLNTNRGINVECYKTSIAKNLSGEGYTTRGAHESYRVRKDFKEKINLFVPFLVLRQLLCGSGGYYNHQPVISPRQFFIEHPTSEVSVPVPMVCLRSESLSAYENYFRLQVLNGDPARSQVSTFLRFALTSLVIECIEKGFIRAVPEIEDPVYAGRLLSESWEAHPPIHLQNGKLISAVNYLQEFYLEAIERLAKETEWNEEKETAKKIFREVLGHLDKNNLEILSRKIEWAIKLDLFEWNFQNYFDVDPDIAFPKETANNTYCAVTDPLFDELEEQLDIARLMNSEEIEKALFTPPLASRGKARTEIVAHFNGYVDEINWDFIMINGEKFKLKEDISWDSDTISNTIKEIKVRAFKK